MADAALTDDLLDFLVGELRQIRRSLPAQWPRQAHYKTDLKLDSLDLVELVARIEQRYGLLVPDTDLPKLISLDATLRYVVERMEE